MTLRNALKIYNLKRFMSSKAERRHFVDLCISNQSVWYSRIARSHPMTAMMVSARAMQHSIGKRREVHLGTEVMYKGDRWLASNGHHNPDCMRWTIRKCTDHSVSEKVREDELEIVRTIKNLKYNALGTYRWWCTSWSSLDISDVLEGKVPASVRIVGAMSPLYGSRWAVIKKASGE